MGDQIQVRSILGALAGVVFGWVAGLFFPQIMIHTSFPAALFEHALQLLVAPLLFTAVILGIAAFGDMAKAGRSVTRLLWYFFGTGAVAAVLALAVSLIFQPGNGASWSGQLNMAQFDGQLSHSFGGVLQSIIPLNLPGSISNGYFTGLVLFAFALGFFLIQAGFKGRQLTDILSIFLGLQKKIFHLLMYILPVGLFFLIGSAVAANAASFSDSLHAISAVFPVLLVTLIIFALLVLPGIQWFATGEMPMRYIVNVKPALATAFAAGSTTAAFPILYQCVSEQQDDNRVTGSSLPFGLLLGTHGSTILTVILTVFAAQAVGMSLGIWQIGMLLLAAIFVPVGIVGFPGPQLVFLGALFHLLQFPAEAYALLAMVWAGEWLLSRFVAPVNTLSSAVGAAVVAGAFDLKTARHTAASHRPSGTHRQDDRRRTHHSQEQRGGGERRYRDREERGSDRERTPQSGGDRPRHGSGGGRDRFDRNRSREGNEGRGERGERGEHRQGRGPDRRSEGRGNRFQGRDDRRQFRQDRQHRETPVETPQEATPEREPVAQAQEPREIKSYTPPVEKQIETSEETPNVSYGRTFRAKPVERESSSMSAETASSEKEPDFPPSGDVSYGRGKRNRPENARNESSETSASTPDEEPVVTGEVSFGRGRRRPQSK